MKKSSTIHRVIAVAALSSVAICANAAGRYLPGTVYIGPNAYYMHADYNVRYNAAATSKAYVSVSADIYYNKVSVFATDSTGVSFYCYIPPTNSLYTRAMQLVGTLGNGTHLYASRLSGTSECDDFYPSVSSDRLD